ncbi:beta-ketoacyl synthase domain-containing protein [Apiospora rasikravindrae]|uniref:Beta-ketoacyl synthase domain-containing protein n=1 Tax=Apiospora rasikravindrae TaxID=990691 RepID=A0ABR1SWD4_9PEZI
MEPWGDTIIHRIDEVAKMHPERAAVVTLDGTSASYENVVHRRVDEICAELDSVGVKADSTVAVLQEPTPDWVSSILAIMRNGATYLPLDLGTPWARLAVMVKDCQPQAVLVDATTKGDVQKLGFGMKVVDVSNKKHRGSNKAPISAAPGAVSTILYTSGSSGVPKGIMLTHRGMKSWLQPCKTLYSMKKSGDVVLQQSSQGFDMSLMQLFTALCFGGSVCLLPRSLRGDARAISAAITRHHVTHTYGTPSEYLSWLRYGNLAALRESSWKTALVGGEPLGLSLLREFAALGKGDLRFQHMYGTTESTFCAAVTELDYMKEVGLEPTDLLRPRRRNFPAGVALPNYNIYILDEQRRPLPVGLQGEIYIGGAGVALGYLNNRALTAETFMPDPFATPSNRAKGWNMMQRTGDLGRWSRYDHRAILIEGRISGDTMVKLRGLRVDLRDVEVALLRAASGDLSEAVVSVHRSSPESPEFLVAHVVFKPDSALVSHGSRDDRVRKLREQLELPLSIQPAHIIALEALPLMSSGKLDRRAVGCLPIPKADTLELENDFVWTATEERLKAVWEQVLVHPARINPGTDFFHIGGTSLSLLSLRDNITAEFGVELGLLDLFEASVLSDMARRIEGKTGTPEAIDWQEETKLAPSLAANGKRVVEQVSQPESNKIVILTGGTGYLGKALVHAMVNDATVKEIHCLGVRNSASRADLRVLDKVTLHEGDLTQPRIGLPRSTIEHLFSRAHVIIHNGADVSYMKTYRSMRQSNFQSTRDLIEWSMPRMIPFHFISTAGIGNLAAGDAVLGETSMASTPPPTDGTAAYTACKWASEVYLENLTKRYPQWPVCVHRPTLIRRDDIPQLDGAHNILGYSRLLGAVPKSRGVARGVFNIVQVDAVVAGVLDCVMRRHGRDGQVHFVNHIGKLDLPLQDMHKWVLDRTDEGYVDVAEGVELDQIPLEEWIRRAIEIGMHPTMGVLLTTFARNGEVNFPTVTKGVPSIRQSR